jgi:hypothetical protein
MLAGRSKAARGLVTFPYTVRRLRLMSRKKEQAWGAASLNRPGPKSRAKERGWRSCCRSAHIPGRAARADCFAVLALDVSDLRHHPAGPDILAVVALDYRGSKGAHMLMQQKQRSRRRDPWT